MVKFLAQDNNGGRTLDSQITSHTCNPLRLTSRKFKWMICVWCLNVYLCVVDVWSAGCVLAELLLGQPMFPGDSGVDQLVEIIKVLGTPTREQIREMNPNYSEFKFPQIKAHPWTKVMVRSFKTLYHIITHLSLY